MKLLKRVPAALKVFVIALLTPRRARRAPVPPAEPVEPKPPRLTRRVVMVAGAAAIIIISAVALYVEFKPRSQRINFAQFVGVGQAMADETARVLGSHGRVVLVVGEEHRDPRSLMGHELTGFLDQLKQHRRIQVVATEVVVPDAQMRREFLEDATREFSLPQKQFELLVAKHQTADVLVTFLGMPAINPAQPLELPGYRPKIIALQTRVQDCKTYLRDKLVMTFIVPRQPPLPSATARPRTPREWFSNDFQVFTLQDLDALP